MTTGFGPQTLRIDAEQEISRISASLRSYLKATKRRGIIVALSGGIDSSVVAALCVAALGKERMLLGRVHLDGQVRGCVDQFDEQQTSVMLPGDGFAEPRSRVGPDCFCQQRAGMKHTRERRLGGDLPRFPDRQERVDREGQARLE